MIVREKDGLPTSPLTRDDGPTRDGQEKVAEHLIPQKLMVSPGLIGVVGGDMGMGGGKGGMIMYDANGHAHSAFSVYNSHTTYHLEGGALSLLYFLRALFSRVTYICAIYDRCIHAPVSRWPTAEIVECYSSV